MKLSRLLPSLALALCLSSGSALADTATCTPSHVAVLSNRIHVRCTASVAGGIWYFALSTADAAHANRMLSLLTSALVGGRSMTIDYNPSSTAGTAIGCLSSDCRLINYTMLF
ncbi:MULTISPECIES: hypothetical protein [Corallococcus]|uniref:hypothetical protein n=1 Tax=Corallococcus TaxID=83461 RepID=UPI00117EAA4B|nr:MULTISPECIES: hypothetical protein [Corallococcus]NBD08496.1 hypothetical protein [Corallococcus silvisoli]TSC34435.1 hypothetical protein FOF48_05285 [Corallococcus sp. Z5C101001]